MYIDGINSNNNKDYDIDFQNLNSLGHATCGT